MADRKAVVVLISGGGTNLQALLDAASDANFPAKIVGVISNKADAYGLERAKKAGVSTQLVMHKDYDSRESFDEALHEAIVSMGAELVCLAGFMRLLTPEFVGKWTDKMINIHPSLLPSFKGLHTHASALEAGVKFAGCTVHFVVPEMDAGPIIIQSAVSILDGDTTDSLAGRVLESEHKIYPQALRWLAEGRLVVDGQSVRVSDAPVVNGAALTNPAIA